jgi:magnesium chelatase family protein
MLATVRSATLLGVAGSAVHVEVHAGVGLPGFQLVGLPDEACREARDRVRAAILSSGFSWPTKRITVNLAPSHYRKIGSGLDLAIAVGVLAATDVLPPEVLVPYAFVAELGLDGSLRPVSGVAPMVAAVRDAAPVVAAGSAREARVVVGDAVRVAASLVEVVGALTGAVPWSAAEDDLAAEVPAPEPDLADVRGQPLARLALEVAAAGGHHLLFVGSPGSGKTMLARRLTGILPPLDADAALEVTMVHSAAGVRLPPSGLITRPPFRAPHHSSSMVALVGGGSAHLRPGEVSLASGGVLFLDELGEFNPSALDALRQPLEDGAIRISRARVNATLPAQFLLVAATNPCPCGGGPPGACECDDGARLRYLRRLSGPLLDRFDLRVSVQRPDVDDLLRRGDAESSVTVAERVRTARARSVTRNGVLNAQLPATQLDLLAPISADARLRLRTELESDRLTGRGYHRVRRVARTIADLFDDGGEVVLDHHVVLAMQLRVGLRAHRRMVAA